jgi:hypothetical protein
MTLPISPPFPGPVEPLTEIVHGVRVSDQNRRPVDQYLAGSSKNKSSSPSILLTSPGASTLDSASESCVQLRSSPNSEVLAIATLSNPPTLEDCWLNLHWRRT